MRTARQLAKLVKDAYAALYKADDATRERAIAIIGGFHYEAPHSLKKEVDKLFALLSAKKKPSNQNTLVGRQLEIVALLACRGLKGVTTIKSIQSAGPQYDLLVGGDGGNWELLGRAFLRKQLKDILVEAKAHASPVGDGMFARVCALLTHNLAQSANLGIFFTLKGASGFPERGKRRQRHLGNSRLRQVIFHAQTGKPIVVLDAEDLSALGRGSNLITMIRKKVRDVEQQSGLAVPVIKGQERDLPAHLKPFAK